MHVFVLFHKYVHLDLDIVHSGECVCALVCASLYVQLYLDIACVCMCV